MGNPKRTGHLAIGTANAARIQRRLDYTVFRSLDRIRRANRCTGRAIAVHANRGACFNGFRSVIRIQVDHGSSAVRVALGAGGHAGFASDTALRIDEKIVFLLHPIKDGHD
jgi:hypothetical protein